jgi:hypothetical protein
MFTILDQRERNSVLRAHRSEIAGRATVETHHVRRDAWILIKQLLNSAKLVERWR